MRANRPRLAGRIPGTAGGGGGALAARLAGRAQAGQPLASDGRAVGGVWVLTVCCCGVCILAAVGPVCWRRAQRGRAAAGLLAGVCGSAGVWLICWRRVHTGSGGADLLAGVCGSEFRRLVCISC